MRGKVNICESLINVVNRQQAKDADRLEPKGTWSGADVPKSSVIVVEPSAEKRDLPQAGTQMERGKPVVFPSGREVVRPTDETAGKGCWKKRMLYCNG